MSLIDLSEITSTTNPHNLQNPYEIQEQPVRNTSYNTELNVSNQLESQYYNKPAWTDSYFSQPIWNSSSEPKKIWCC